MKRTLITLASSIGCLILSSTAMTAQDAGWAYQIPFSFNAEGKTMPAGHYAASQVSHSVEQLRGPKGAILFNDGIRPLTCKPGAAHLTFVKYGDTYFLHEVWNEQGQGTKLPESRRERSIQTEQQQAQVQPQTVVLMASR